VIASEIKRLDNVVKTFLNFNRPIELEAKSINLSELVEDVIALCRRRRAPRTSRSNPTWKKG
jgi:nitrogen fixation/metabolism regulation signal transduction histidine kinase